MYKVIQYTQYIRYTSVQIGKVYKVHSYKVLKVYSYNEYKKTCNGRKCNTVTMCREYALKIHTNYTLLSIHYKLYTTKYTLQTIHYKVYTTNYTLQSIHYKVYKQL